MRLNKSLFKNSKSGFTLVEFIAAGTIIFIGAMLTSSILLTSSQMQTSLSSKSGVSQFKQQLMDILLSQKNWETTLYHPSNSTTFSCILTGADCLGAGGSFMAFQGNNSLFYDPASYGVKTNGLACANFSQDSTDCFIRYVMVWSPICPSNSTCINPRIKVTGTLQGNWTKFGYSEGSQVFNFEVTPTLDLLSRPIAISDQILENLYQADGSTLNSSIDLDVLKNDFIFYTANSVNLQVLGSTSVKGAGLTVAMSNSGQQVIRYVPTATTTPGLDFFQYKITYRGLESVGWVWLRLMTPYTWTGLSSNSTKSTSDRRNFCGRVVNNACDGQTFPSGRANVMYLFNELSPRCTVCAGCAAGSDPIPTEACTVYLESTGGATLNINGLQATSEYKGRIVQQGSVTIGPSYSGCLTHECTQSAFDVMGGSFIGSTNASHILRVLPLGNPQSAPANDSVALKSFWAFRFNGARFEAPVSFTSPTPFEIQNPSGFIHNNGTLTMGGNGGSLDKVHGTFGDESRKFTANGAAFYNLKFSPYGLITANQSSGGIMIDGNFQVENFYWDGRSDTDIFGSWGSDASADDFVVSIKGNIYLMQNSWGGKFSYYYSRTPWLELNGLSNQTVFGKPTNNGTPALLTDDVNPLDGSMTNVPFLPSLRINKTTNLATLQDNIGIHRKMAFQNGPVIANGSRVIFSGVNAQSSIDFTPGTIWYDSLVAGGTLGSFRILGNTLNLNGTYTRVPLKRPPVGANQWPGSTMLNPCLATVEGVPSPPSTATQINVRGNVVTDFSGGNIGSVHASTHKYNLIGTNDQTLQAGRWTATAICAGGFDSTVDGVVEINKTSGNVTVKDAFSGYPDFYLDFINTSNSLFTASTKMMLASSTVNNMFSPGQVPSFNPGTARVPDLYISPAPQGGLSMSRLSARMPNVVNVTNLRIGGFSTTDSACFNVAGNRFDVSGNVLIGCDDRNTEARSFDVTLSGSSSTLLNAGTTNATSAAAGVPIAPNSKVNLTVNKSGGTLTFGNSPGSAINRATYQSLNVVNGTFTLSPGANLSFGSVTMTGGTLNMSSAATTLNAGALVMQNPAVLNKSSGTLNYTSWNSLGTINP